MRFILKLIWIVLLTIGGFIAGGFLTDFETPEGAFVGAGIGFILALFTFRQRKKKTKLREPANIEYGAVHEEARPAKPRKRFVTLKRVFALFVLTGIVVVGLVTYDYYQDQKGRQSLRQQQYSEARLTEQQAINTARAYLVNASKPRIEWKSKSRLKRVPCSSVEMDYNFQCKQDLGANKPQGFKFVQEQVSEKVQVPGQCPWPPANGQWTAQYNRNSRTWNVVQFDPGAGRRSWTVDHRTGEVNSHQPPC